MQIIKDRKYIHHLERLNEGEILWDNWEKIVALTQKQIEEALRNYKPPKKTKIQSYKVYGYNRNGDLIKVWENKKDCADELGNNETTTYNYVIKNYVLEDYLLSKEELTKDVAFSMYRNAIEKGHLYKKGITTTNYRGKPIYCYNEMGKLVSCYESKTAFTEATNKRPKRLNKEDRIIENKLVSYSYYDEATAKETYWKRRNR